MTGSPLILGLIALTTAALAAHVWAQPRRPHHLRFDASDDSECWQLWRSTMPPELWYYETRSMIGKWVPNTAPKEPSTATRPNGLCLIGADGRPGNRVRAVHRVHPDFAHLPLTRLQQAYSPDSADFGQTMEHHQNAPF